MSSSGRPECRMRVKPPIWQSLPRAASHAAFTCARAAPRRAALAAAAVCGCTENRGHVRLCGRCACAATAAARALPRAAPGGRQRVTGQHHARLCLVLRVISRTSTHVQAYLAPKPLLLRRLQILIPTPPRKQLVQPVPSNLRICALRRHYSTPKRAHTRRAWRQQGAPCGTSSSARAPASAPRCPAPLSRRGTSARRPPPGARILSVIQHGWGCCPPSDTSAALRCSKHKWQRQRARRGVCHAASGCARMRACLGSSSVGSTSLMTPDVQGTCGPTVGLVASGCACPAHAAAQGLCALPGGLAGAAARWHRPAHVGAAEAGQGLGRMCGSERHMRTLGGWGLRRRRMQQPRRHCLRLAT